MNELLTSLKINAEMTDEERKEIEKIYEKVRKRNEDEGQNTKQLEPLEISDKSIAKILNGIGQTVAVSLACLELNRKQDCTCDDCDNEPPTFEDGIIYAYENVIKLLIGRG